MKQKSKNDSPKYHEFLKKMDIFETPISLSYNNRYLYETKFGGFLTIITFIIILSYSIWSLSDLFQGKHYSLISNERDDYNYILDFSNVPFAFKLVNSKGNDLLYDKSIYDYRIITTESYYTENSNGKVNNYFEHNIEFDYCEKFVGLNKLYEYFNISNLLCIKPGQNLTMYGKFGDINSGFKGFRLYINKCNSRIANNTCFDMEYINKKLANIKLTFFYLGYTINHYLNDKNVIKHKVYSVTNSLSINFMKKFFYKFQKGNYYLYNNILWNKKESIYFYISDGLEFDFELDSSNSIATTDDSLGYFAFNTNAKVIEYTKTLNSLWDVIARIGGIFNIVVSIAKIINSFIAKKILLLDINEHLINNRHSPGSLNKIEIKEGIEQIHKNNKNIILQKNQVVNNDSSSVQINNKNDKFIELNLKDGLNYNNSNNIYNENIDNISAFSKKQKTKINIINRIEHSNKLLIILYYICPFFILEKIPKMEYFVKLEQNYSECFSIENLYKILEIEKLKTDNIKFRRKAVIK